MNGRIARASFVPRLVALSDIGKSRVDGLSERRQADGQAVNAEVLQLPLNIDIPKQISVLGVDNDEILCNISTPTLSSIMPNLQHNGYLAAQALDRLFKAKRRQPFSRVVCSTFQVAGAGTIANAILKARLAEVAKRLRASETPISHIASQCSFNNLQHLANAFKRQYGQSMTAYRRASKTIALPL